jgi:hypothetical protein
VAALKAFKGKSPARLAHAYISEEGHLCPWGDRRRSAIIAQTSVKHGGGVAINLGFLKDSGAWDQYPYISGEWPDDDCQLLEGVSCEG